LILYLDTSLLVTGLTLEKNTRAVQIWMAERENDAFAISDWVIAEFSSALSVKLRVGDITPQHRAEALAQFGRIDRPKPHDLARVGSPFPDRRPFRRQLCGGLAGG
jgi:hypothetical protein